MTGEQRKWYAMGANDMEAGRLVSDSIVTAEEAKAMIAASYLWTKPQARPAHAELVRSGWAKLRDLVSDG